MEEVLAESPTKNRESFTNLFEVYKTLLGIEKTKRGKGSSEAKFDDPGRRIRPQQYDEFVKLWRGTAEYHCILYNCWLPVEEDKGKPLIPLPADYQPCEHSPRARALAEVMGELLWIFVVEFDCLPILEIATSCEKISAGEIKKIAGPNHQIVSLCFSTFGAFYFNRVFGQAGKTATEPKTGSYFEAVGWVDESFVTRFVPYKNNGDDSAITLSNSLDSLNGWMPYTSVEQEKKIQLFDFFSFHDYFSTHAGELVAGFTRIDDRFTAEALNGVEVTAGGFSEVTEDVLHTDIRFSQAATNHIGVFRPWYLARKYHPGRLLAPTSGPTSITLHIEARKDHLAKVSEMLPTSAITLTFSLAPELDSGETGSELVDVASCFASFFITELDRSPALNPERPNISELPKVTARIWEDLEILKLPLAREMLREQLRKVRKRNEEVEGNNRIFAMLSESFQTVAASLNTSQRAVIELQKAFQTPSSGLFFRAEHVQKIFQQSEMKIAGHVLVLNHQGEANYATTRGPAHTQDIVVLQIWGVVRAYLGKPFSKPCPRIGAIDFTTVKNELQFEIAKGDRASELLLHALNHDLLACNGVQRVTSSDLKTILNELKYIFHRTYKTINHDEYIPVGLIKTALPSIEIDSDWPTAEKLNWQENLWAPFSVYIEDMPGEKKWLQYTNNAKLLPLKPSQLPFARIVDFLELVCHIVSLGGANSDGRNASLKYRNALSKPAQLTITAKRAFFRHDDNSQRLLTKLADPRQAAEWYMLNRTVIHGDFNRLFHAMFSRTTCLPKINFNTKRLLCTWMQIDSEWTTDFDSENAVPRFAILLSRNSVRISTL